MALKESAKDRLFLYIVTPISFFVWLAALLALTANSDASSSSILDWIVLVMLLLVATLGLIKSIQIIKKYSLTSKEIIYVPEDALQTIRSELTSSGKNWISKYTDEQLSAFYDAFDAHMQSQTETKSLNEKEVYEILKPNLTEITEAQVKDFFKAEYVYLREIGLTE